MTSHLHEPTPSKCKPGCVCMFLPLAGPNVEHLEHDVSINRAGVSNTISNCWHVHIGRQRPHLVQHTDEELVGVLHGNTQIKSWSTDYVRTD